MDDGEVLFYLLDRLLWHLDQMRLELSTEHHLGDFVASPRHLICLYHVDYLVEFGTIKGEHRAGLTLGQFGSHFIELGLSTASADLSCVRHIGETAQF